MVPQPLPGLKMCDHYTNITKRSVSSVIADSELEFFTWNLSRNGRWTLLLQLSGMTNFWVFLHSDEEFSCFVLWCQLLCPKLNGTRWRLLRSSYLFVLPICKHSVWKPHGSKETARNTKNYETHWIWYNNNRKTNNKFCPSNHWIFVCKKKYQPLKKKVWNQKLFILWLTIKSCII